ncbi:MAG: DegT/DnrJ/EryC1/StrS family aminotransferase [Planctomycetes bacterium]|nr:DegT/DnrJ/EryC1/StrS family aminotransferase [Planctomycetota bacterium]
MYARKRLDISWSDLASGMFYALFRRDARSAARAVEEWFAPAPPGEEPGAVAFLSVRSGLDLYLRLSDLPRGSEVLMSALTIPDMWKVVEQHGLVPVPVDLDTSTLAPLEERLRALCTPKTKLILVAHLFGTRIDLEACARFARERGLLLIEDSAQAFTGADYKGDPRADVSLFSFGPIKTAAALAGGVLVVRDAPMRARLRAEQARYPLQSSSAYFWRLWKYSFLKFLTLRLPYSVFARFCELRGKSLDEVIQGTVRGFKGGDFFEKIPPPALRRAARAGASAPGGLRRKAHRGAHTRGTRTAHAPGNALRAPGRRRAAAQLLGLHAGDQPTERTDRTPAPGGFRRDAGRDLALRSGAGGTSRVRAASRAGNSLPHRVRAALSGDAPRGDPATRARAARGCAARSRAGPRRARALDGRLARSRERISAPRPALSSAYRGISARHRGRREIHGASISRSGRSERNSCARRAVPGQR